MTKEDERVLWVVAGVYLFLKYSGQWMPSLQQQGANLYEALHPSETQHKNDLPGKQLTRAAILDLAIKAGFPNPKLAAAIALAESGGVVNAIMRSSREISVGLWQINTKVHPYSPADMAVPAKNAAAAFKISKGGTNWTPWSAFTNGNYKKFQTGILA